MGGGGVAARRDELRSILAPEEAARLEDAEAIPDPGERLSALAQLADELTIAHAREERDLDAEGRLATTRQAFTQRYGAIRRAVLDGHDEEIEAALAARREVELPRGVAAAERERQQAGFIADAERTLRRAGLPPDVEREHLERLRRRFAPDDRDHVVRSAGELESMLAAPDACGEEHSR